MLKKMIPRTSVSLSVTANQMLVLDCCVVVQQRCCAQEFGKEI